MLCQLSQINIIIIMIGHKMYSDNRNFIQLINYIEWITFQKVNRANTM